MQGLENAILRHDAVCTRDQWKVGKGVYVVRPRSRGLAVWVLQRPDLSHCKLKGICQAQGQDCSTQATAEKRKSSTTKQLGCMPSMNCYAGGANGFDGGGGGPGVCTFGVLAGGGG